MELLNYPVVRGRRRNFIIFGRVNYDYLKIYIYSNPSCRWFLEFARGNRWGYFPSVSGGWIITEEPFMESLSGVFDFLKLRVSWGKMVITIPSFNIFQPFLTKM